MKIKTQNEVQTIGPAFFDSGRKRGENDKLESYEVPRLNEALSQFFAELRKVNGKEYEPDSLKVMQGHASVFRSLFKNEKLSQICRVTYRVPVVKTSPRRKGKKVSQAWNRKNGQTKPKA